MANQRAKSSLLLVCAVFVIAALVAVSVAAVLSQLALQEQEVLVREVYGDWNGLLSEAKSLGLAPTDSRAQARFRASLRGFEGSLARLAPGGVGPFGSLVDVKRDSLRSSLEFSLQLIRDVEGWLGASGTPDALHQSWIHDRLTGLDDLFGSDVVHLKDVLNGLINTSLRETSSQLTLLAIGLVAALLALLGFLLARMEGLNRTLNGLNTQLGEMVEHRTAHLDEAMARLEHTQNQLVASEKLAVLGNLAAGVAHELNTPLAALRSGAEAVGAFFLQDLEASLLALHALEPPVQALFFEVIQTAFHQSATEFRRPDRLSLRALTDELEALGAPEAARQARGWTDLGLAGSRQLWSRVCLHPQAHELFSLALPIVEARSMAGVIVDAVAKSSHVVGSLRHYLEGSLSEEPVVFELLPEWASVLGLLTSHFKKGVALSVAIPPGLSVWGTKERLSQVWLNLVNNALHAMGGKGSLTIEAEPVEAGVAVRVIDSGTGIDPAIQNQIFTPFFTTKRETGGLGLGLDICRKIVERNGGTLTFESEPGRTAFTVVLPAEPLSVD